MEFDEKKLLSFVSTNKQMQVLVDEQILEIIPLIEKGRLEEVRELLEDGANANEEDYFKGSALFVAVVKREYKIAKLLCSFGANPFHLCANHSTAFYESLVQDNHDLALYFINNSLDHYFESINDFEFFEIMQCQISPDILFALVSNGYNFDVVELYRKFPEYKWIPKTIKRFDNERKSELVHLLHHSLDELKLYGVEGMFNEIMDAFSFKSHQKDELVG